MADVTLGERVFAPSIRAASGIGSSNTTIVLRDVTERRRAEERKLDFYSIIAHDLRSPLSAMMMRTRVMLEDPREPVSPGVAQHLQKFQASMKSMVEIINDFLDLARLDQGPTLETAEVNLATLVDDVVEDLRPLATAGNLHIECTTTDDEIRVMGDKSRLGQVVCNLVANAIKFSPPDGTIRISTCAVGNSIETVVADSGPGIAADALPHLFERFTRAQANQKSGTGLGLMIVKEIVEAHGGTAGVNTSIGHGSEFWFRLPKLPDSSAAHR